MEELNKQLDEVLGATRLEIPEECITETEKKDFLEGQKKLLKSDFMRNYEVREENGQPVFFKEDEKQINIKDGKPLTASELIQKDYRLYMPEFLTREEVYIHLRKKGFADGTKLFMDKAVQLITKHKIEN